MATPLPELLVPDAAAWRAWLEEHHAGSPGVWLVLHKKGGTATTLAYEDAVLEALCFGWIDGQLSGRDGGTYRLRFTPRTRSGRWSAKNVERVERLSAEGLMRPEGVAAVEAAKADGRWEAAYAGSSAAEPPPEFLDALDAVPSAREAYGRLNAANRYAIYYRLHAVKKAQTRERKIGEFVRMLAAGQAPYAQAGFEVARSDRP
ncbi:hypothetical protein NCCP1664_11190 [Zafaria cholistanensis]|uniref:Bacteriocin-protection protein n=1 Tax=Zafaria cholistanensis TaxID=1682741 RepID=A0A5A7NR69_9MICC|nr:YdeI/OmpD-associated family protein [Zafaria cholistanensis]GER22622.1 hypothetical protein NCCP1664_11190 [Zafaria cholistanensis]